MFKSFLYSTLFTCTGFLCGNQLYKYIHLKDYKNLDGYIVDYTERYSHNKKMVKFSDIPYYIIVSLLFSLSGGTIGYLLSRYDLQKLTYK